VSLALNAHMNRAITLTIVLLVLAGCTVDKPTFLEGEWRSNKALTLEHIKDGSITTEQRDFLVRELGNLTIVFKGNKSAIYFLNDYDVGKELEWGNFSILESTDKSFTLSVINSQIDGKNFEYTWSGDCFYLNSSEWNFHEYFCRVE
jgi:hypothetical protein